ncbi:MAG: hypothetical protein EA379_01445 [Phycisphaerales bacterium]|nr:MAG: hypothetical protein EA379_01445 [Phycisphaerales bacterium]
MSHHADTSALMSRDNVTQAPGAGKMLSVALIAVGVVALALTLIGGMTGDSYAARAAMLNYHIGFIAVLAVTLGGMAFVMISHQTGAGWSAGLRRQFENLMSMVPICAVLFLPIFALCFLSPGLLFKWMDAAYVAGDPIYDHKRAYLNMPFFAVRAILFFAVWAGLAFVLMRLSLKQDETGDKWLTRSMRRFSAPGILLFALATAFASFDWIMGLDFHWFSTMFPIYYFAQGILAAFAAVTLILLVNRRAGRLQGVVTEEHFHDLGKLIFGFIVFWAYISFSQYFLIWYANIPEETAFMSRRRTGEWMSVSVVLVALKFIVPFLVMLPRPNRRNPVILAAVCAWLLVMHLVDFFWVIRPELFSSVARGMGFSWLDIVGPIGPVAIYAGVLIRTIASRPLVCLKDPRLPQALHHKNYI